MMVSQLMFVLQVAKVAKHRWRQVGWSLGLKLADLDEYEEREPESLEWRLYRLLVDWKEKAGHPTVGALISGCEKADVGGEVKRKLGLPREKENPDFS